jgi:transcriptional regulator with XRE-family HTH domain
VNGTTLRRLRKSLKLTQRQLAARLGVDRVSVARWETDVHPVPKLAVTALRLLTAAHKTSHEKD